MRIFAEFPKRPRVSIDFLAKFTILRDRKGIIKRIERYEFSQNEKEEGKLVGSGDVEQILQIFTLILQSYPQS